MPYGSYGDMYRDHQALLDHLSASMGRDVSLQLFANYTEMIQAIRETRLELAWLGPLAYLEVERDMASHPNLRVVPIVKPSRYGKSEYVSEIIVRRDSGIDTLADLRGRRMAFVDTESTAGYLLAAAYLVKCGISPRDPLLSRQNFVNQYGNVVLSVLFGKYDAGAVFEGAPAMFLKGREIDRRQELKVLARSDPVPYEPIAAMIGGRLTDSQAMHIQTLFLSLDKSSDILKKLQVAGFVAASPGEYKSIRAMTETVKQIQRGI